MKTIKVLRNFGVGANHHDVGTTITVDPDSFGGTYDDMLEAGLFEEVDAAAPALDKTATIDGPGNPNGVPVGTESKPTAKGGKMAKVTEPDGTVIEIPAGSSVEEPT